MKKENNNVVVKTQVILNAIQDLQRLSLLLFNNIRGRCQIKFGMTALLNNDGFTLIELLVVVLIIGILAAVAVPQYQVAVAKSRVSTFLPTIKALTDAQEVYYLTHGEYAPTFNELDIAIPSECTPIEDDPYKEAEEGEMLRCGNYFVLSYDPNKAINANYCPYNNDSWDACQSTRDILINYRLLHRASNADEYKYHCDVKNRSALGKKICTSWKSIFKCSGC